MGGCRQREGRDEVVVDGRLDETHGAGAWQARRGALRRVGRRDQAVELERRPRRRDENEPRPRSRRSSPGQLLLSGWAVPCVALPLDSLVQLALSRDNEAVQLAEEMATLTAEALSPSPPPTAPSWLDRLPELRPVHSPLARKRTPHPPHPPPPDPQPHFRLLVARRPDHGASPLPGAPRHGLSRPLGPPVSHRLHQGVAPVPHLALDLVLVVILLLARAQGHRPRPRDQRCLVRPHVRRH